MTDPLTGPDLAAAVATEVMGWRRWHDLPAEFRAPVPAWVAESYAACWWRPDGGGWELGEAVAGWRPDQDWRAMGEVVERLTLRRFAFALDCHAEGGPVFARFQEGWREYAAEAPFGRAPEAVCRAALRAVRG